MTGLFVVFEGGDGVGKTTQVTELAQRLARAGIAHIVTRQPGGTGLGATLRGLVLDPERDVDPRAEALMYAADKAQHVHEVVRPALSRGEVVVCDRYVDSMIAYQGAGRALDMGEVSRVGWWAVGGLRPHLTVLLDVAPGDAVERIAAKDRLEAAGADFHERARQHFLDLAAERPGEYLIINGREPCGEIADRVESKVRGLLGR